MIGEWYHLGSYQYILNSNVPDMDPYKTPMIASEHKYYVPLKFTFLFCFVRCKCDGIRKGISTP